MQLTWTQWLSIWIASIWSLKGRRPNAQMKDMEAANSTQLFTQMTGMQQEQMQLSKEMLEIRHMVQDLLVEFKALSDDISRMDIDSCSTESKDMAQVSKPSTTMTMASRATSSDSKIRLIDISLDDMELYRPGSSYYWISNSYKVQVPDKPWKKKCKLAILISSGPYAGSAMIANIISALLEMIKVSYRGSAVWNFHAHSNRTTEQMQPWLNEFHTWLHSLKRGDIVILRTPFYQEDGNAARQVCQNSFIINSLPSLQDMALLHRFSPIVLSSDRNENKDSNMKLNPQVDDKTTLDILRQVLSHQKRWKDDANLTLGWNDFQEIENITMILCQELIQNYMGFSNVCNDTILLNKLQMENDAVQESLPDFLEQEDRLRQIRNQVRQEDVTLFLNQVHSTFYHWIFTESKS